MSHVNPELYFSAHWQKGRASPGLLLAHIAAQHGWVQGVTKLVQGMTKSGVQVFLCPCLVQGLT